MSKKLIGLLVFVVGIGLAVGVVFFGGGNGGTGDALTNAIRGPQLTRVVAFIGGEKRLLLEDEKVREILRDKRNLIIDARKAGSLEMAETDLRNQKPDLLWPGSQIAAEVVKSKGVRPSAEDIVFSTPVVMFSWSPVADALVDKGIAHPISGSSLAYQLDTGALVAMIRDKAKWSDIGLPDLYGKVMVYSTDPLHSNSGLQYATLVTEMLMAGREDPETLRTALADTGTIFQRMGYKERSSFDLFDQYLRTGMAAKPIIVGYENQMIEFAAANPDIWKTAEGQPVRPIIFYPDPTQFASHVALALTDNGKQAMDALRDPDVLALAWRRHGFRSGLASATDVRDLPIQGVPASSPRIIPAPPLSLVEQILAAVTPQS